MYPNTGTNLGGLTMTYPYKVCFFLPFSRNRRGGRFALMKFLHNIFFQKTAVFCDERVRHVWIISRFNSRSRFHIRRRVPVFLAEFRRLKSIAPHWALGIRLLLASSQYCWVHVLELISCNSYRVEALFKSTWSRQCHACPRVKASRVEAKILNVELDRFPVVENKMKLCHIGPF